jgi:hypothetical protein
MQIYTLTLIENKSYRPVGTTSDLLIAERWATEQNHDYFASELDNLAGLGLSSPLPLAEATNRIGSTSLDLTGKTPIQKRKAALEALGGLQSKMYFLAAILESRGTHH